MSDSEGLVEEIEREILVRRQAAEIRDLRAELEAKQACYDALAADMGDALAELERKDAALREAGSVTMWAVIVDGDEGPVWECHSGGRDGPDYHETVQLRADTFPPDTKIEIRELRALTERKEADAHE